MTTAYIGLRSSIGDSPGYIREGLRQLSALGCVTKNSDLYRSSQLRNGQPQYIAVAVLETNLSRETIALRLRAAAREYNYSRDGVECGALDMDVIAYDDLSQDGTSPHVSDIAANLAASVGELVIRVTGTAQPASPRTLDYDEPGGAGCGYDDLRPVSDFNRRLFDEAAATIGLRPDMKILDVGCGTGRFCVLFAKRGAVVTGLDRSMAMLAAAREAARDAPHLLHYIHADANAGLPAGNFDAVTFFLSIQYLELTPQFWGSLRKALAPGGIVVIVTLPHRHFIENESLTRFFPSIPRIDLARFPSIPTLVRLLREHGFSSIEEHEIAQESVTEGDTLLARVERKFVSTLHLLDDSEFTEGLKAMRAELAGQTQVHRTLRATLVSARSPG